MKTPGLDSNRGAEPAPVLLDVQPETLKTTSYLPDHGLGQDLSSLGTADDVGGLEQDLGSVLDGLQVPLLPGRHGRQDGLVDELLRRQRRGLVSKQATPTSTEDVFLFLTELLGAEMFLHTNLLLNTASPSSYSEKHISKYQ